MAITATATIVIINIMRRRFVRRVVSSAAGAGLASMTSARIELDSRNRPGGDVTRDPCDNDSTTVESRNMNISDFIEGTDDEEMEEMNKKMKQIPVPGCIIGYIGPEL